MAKKAATKKKVTKKKASTRKKSSAAQGSATTSKKKSTRKRSSSRRKSKPAAPVSRSFPEMIAAQPDATQQIARRLRGLVLETLADVVESVVVNEQRGLALYTRGAATNVLCGIQPDGDACLLYVQNVQQQEGDRLELRGEGKNSRHVRFEQLHDVAHDEVRNLLRRVSLHAES